ncbi:MAG: hypothetical protein GXO12_04640, partial [Epsilonproteobacteria bacterium]|nr:hypothetical protein [Campylobacterota bacterium]
VAYLKLLANPNDNESLSILKAKNKNLYYAYKFQTAAKKNDKKLFQEVLNKSNDPYLKDLSDYQISSLDGKKSDIEKYINDVKPGLLKNMALLEDAYLLLKENKKDEAKLKLSMIEVDSPLRSVAVNFEHYIK